MLEGSYADGLRSLRQQVRLIMLLYGSEKAGIAPIRLNHLHTYSYLSNVLAPVWKERVFDGRILKKRGGPYYPILQHDLDLLIGKGVVLITKIRHFCDIDEQWRIDGFCSLNHALIGQVLSTIETFPTEFELQSFLVEIAYAMSSLRDSEMECITSEDPTYSNASIGFESVLDFAEWRMQNYSAAAAQHFATLIDRATPGELLHLYTRHLVKRLRDDP